MAILKQLNKKTFFKIPDADLAKYAIAEADLAETLKGEGIRLGTSVSEEEMKADAHASHWVFVVCPNCGHNQDVHIRRDDDRDRVFCRCHECHHHFWVWIN